MRLAIPSAPRPVRLQQVPGALLRVGVVGGVALLVTVLAWWASVRLEAPLAGQRAFLERAVAVKGQVSEVKLPPLDRRLQDTARLRAIYVFEGKDYSASQIELEATVAEGLGPGASLELLIDPARPFEAQEARFARDRAGLVWLGSLVVGLGLLVTLALVAFELRRAVRRELDPLRVGALVWLTPDVELPQTRAELRFPAHYFRDDQKLSVTARGRPGRRPVRNGEKVLAAVVPSQPTWVRVVDEDLARTLGWYQ